VCPKGVPTSCLGSLCLNCEMGGSATISSPRVGGWEQKNSFGIAAAAPTSSPLARLSKCELCCSPTLGGAAPCFLHDPSLLTHLPRSLRLPAPPILTHAVLEGCGLWACGLAPSACRSREPATRLHITTTVERETGDRRDGRS
jgi:hypothetical protein